MLTLRLSVLVMSGVGLFVGLPLSDARACDNDRYPCPIVSETPAQDSAVQARSASRKKVRQPARQDEKPQARIEQSAPRAAGTKETSKPAIQEPAAAPTSQQATESASPIPERSAADQSANDESQESPNEHRVATAATTWPVPDTNGASEIASGTNRVDTAENATTNTVQIVDTKEVNDLDRAADALKASWDTYLLIVLAAALVAGSAMWFFLRLNAGSPRQRATV